MIYYNPNMKQCISTWDTTVKTFIYRCECRPCISLHVLTNKLLECNLLILLVFVEEDRRVTLICIYTNLDIFVLLLK